MDPTRWQHIRTIFEACLDVPPAQRAAFLKQACGEDKDLLLSVQALLKAEEAESPFLDDSLHVESIQALDLLSETKLVGGRVGAYQILSRLGRGGMGTVYLAERADGMYEQKVAIKLVEQAVYREDLVRRFRHERRILASLHHPHIARMLDGGVTESGIPYFVMEYIEGSTLLEYCKDHDLPISDRLTLFCTVCDAVHHAHQNLVIHRDLKPSNILVTDGFSEGSPSGDVKLLDFGVAKLLTDATEDGTLQTMAGQNPMTIGYASPEQVKAEPVTTASDVYSLGVILYELLTGMRPYDIHGLSAAAVERLVCDAIPERPSASWERKRSSEAGSTGFNSKTRLLKGDLDTIVLKALAKEPARRYVSVAQFAEDVRRHLTRQPVIARPMSIKYRVGRFIQRHKIGVGISVFVLISLVSSVIITTNQARQAELNAAHVRRLANTLLFELNDKVRDLPGATDVRRTLVTHALTYLETLSNEKGKDPTLQLELAEAYEQAGRIQGDPHYTNLGDLMGAVKSYEKALALREAIWEADSTSEVVRRALANNYGRLAVVKSWCCDNKLAIELSTKGLNMMAPLLAIQPGNVGIRHDIARIQSELGWWMIWEGKMDKGLSMVSDAVVELETLAVQLPNMLDVQHHLWRAYAYKYDGFKFKKSHQEARDLMEMTALKHIERVNLRYPNHPLLMYDRHVGYLFLGEMQETMGENEKALESFSRSLAISEDLVEVDSTNQKAMEAVAYAAAAKGRVLSQLNNIDEAVRLLSQVVSIRYTLFDQNRSNGEAGNALGNATRTLCQILMKASRLDQALKECQDSALVFTSLVEHYESGPVIVANYGRACLELARVYQALHARSSLEYERETFGSEGLKWFAKGIEIMTPLEAPPGSVLGTDESISGFKAEEAAFRLVAGTEE